jgi:hypothetical protein
MKMLWIEMKVKMTKRMRGRFHIEIEGGEGGN